MLKHNPDIEHLWRKGLTYSKIANVLGITRSAVAGYLWRRGYMKEHQPCQQKVTIHFEDLRSTSTKPTADG
jgi:predicted transcriptional regulator